MYLQAIIEKYQPRDLSQHSFEIRQLIQVLTNWANTCYLDIQYSGSIAKNTAISLASDVDFLVSLSSNCNENKGGLKSIYDSLHATMQNQYSGVRIQNVSVRINLGGLSVDITPARRHSGNTNYHSLYVSKQNTWKQTNIQKHISDISNSRRINEIKLLKIWRELNALDFPSIYLEYLVKDIILFGKSTRAENLESNVYYALLELSKSEKNPLFRRVVDPANSNNVLSDLLDVKEKMLIINSAALAVSRRTWNEIFW